MHRTNFGMSKYLTLLSFIVLASSCKQPDGKQEAKPAPPSETITVKKDTLESEMVIPGELIPHQQVDLYAKITGFVKELKVDIGSKVKTGQVLIVLEAPEITAQLSVAQSRLKSQEALYTASVANYNRLIETSKTPGTISPNDLEQAEARKNADFANLEAAKASHKEVNDVKDYLVLRAPFDGTITARNLNIGAYVGPSGRGSELPALVLQQQDKLRLVVSVPETYTAYIQPGDEVSFKVRAMPGEVFKAKLVRLSGSLDQRLRSQRMEADIKNIDGKFLAGTVADITFGLRSRDNSFAVLKTAVVTTTESAFVIRVVNQKAERVKIKKGIQSGESIEVYGDLKEGDVLLKKANEEIKDGQEIK
ncbi:MAG: efflux RND transporter periplasmic adaptor subunit [Bacteroidota bacterium]